MNGINATLWAVRRAGLRTVGTRRLDLGRGKLDLKAELETLLVDFVSYTVVKGWRVAWVGCAMVVNSNMLRKYGFEDLARRPLVWAHVLHCRLVAPMVRRLASDPSVDAVLVSAHAGAEWEPRNTKRVTDIVEAILEAGAAAVFGGHSHVVQNVDLRRTRDGRNVVAAYSMGSFVSGMSGFKTQASMLTHVTRVSGTTLRRSAPDATPHGCGCRSQVRGAAPRLCCRSGRGRRGGGSGGRVGAPRAHVRAHPWREARALVHGGGWYGGVWARGRSRAQVGRGRGCRNGRGPGGLERVGGGWWGRRVIKFPKGGGSQYTHTN